VATSGMSPAGRTILTRGQLTQRQISARIRDMAARVDAGRGHNGACSSATGVDYTADCAASDMLPGSSADAPSGAAFPASREVSSGAAGMFPLAGGLAVVQRCAHDMASLQYQRISAHA
jgi:hypothetical protein